jgi:hypothetical protein
MMMDIRTELDFHDTRTAMDMLFRSDIAVMIKSKPGQGKTSMIQQYAESRGPQYGLFEINCSLANQPDFMGWFYRCTESHTDFEGNKFDLETGRYTFPYFGFDKRTNRPWHQFKEGVIVFEEYGQTDLDLKKALGQTFLEKRVGQHKVPEGFDIVGLSNYDTDRSAVGRDYDFLINRWGELYMHNTIDNFLVFAHAKKFLNMTMAFASIPQHQVFEGVTPKEQGPFLTPRSTESLDKFMHTVLDAKVPLDDPIVRVTAAGIVGSGAAHQFIAFASLRSEIPSVDQIIKDPEGTPVPKQTDRCMFLVFNMADKAEKGNIKQLVTYMARMPSDMAVAFYRNALLRDKSLMSCREFGDWAVQNKALLAVVNSRV